jgi:hypothetical protein
MATQTPQRQTIRISDIEASDEVRPRDRTDPDTILAYRAAYAAGEQLPPIVVFADDERPGRFWLADGWHRLAAQLPEGEDPENVDDFLADVDASTEVEAEIHPGGKVAAMLYAASANRTHGRPRSRYDAIAAAKVAIRALTLQNPERRPTIEAVKDTAHVGTEIAQRAFHELEADQRDRAPREGDAAWLPPKDSRGGARERFVPHGANPLDTLREPPKLYVLRPREPVPPPPPFRTVQVPVTNTTTEIPVAPVSTREMTRRVYLPSAFHHLSNVVRHIVATDPHTAAVTWRKTDHTTPLATTLRECAATLTAYADALEGLEMETPENRKGSSDEATDAS